MSLAKDLEPTLESTPIAWDGVDLPPPGSLLSDEPPLETDLHLRQILLLISCLEWLWRDRQDFYCIGNLTIYFSPRQLKSEHFRGPDFFVVLNTERKPRNSWVVWEEDGRYPNLIIELLSASTADVDRGVKKQIYQDIFRTPEYIWFDPASLEFQGFQLVDGQYQALEPNAQGWLWSQQLQLFLGLVDGKLRFLTPTGELVATPAETAANVQAELLTTQQDLALTQQDLAVTQQELLHERQQRERLAARLRALGIEPDQL